VSAGSVNTYSEGRKKDAYLTAGFLCKGHTASTNTE